MTAAQPITGYNTHRAEDKQAMLQAIGVATIDDLFANIPSQLRLQHLLNLPEPMPEWVLERHLRELAESNATTQTHCNYLGGGAYEHYIPSVIDAIVSRGEFLTSYTPYQPEISQGLLQALFEYQTAMSAVTGLPVVNGSCYDGATALADAAWTACVIADKQAIPEVLVSAALWPHYRAVLETYGAGRNLTMHNAAFDVKTGATDLAKLDAELARLKPAGFIFQTPNALGVVEDVEAIVKLCQKHGVVTSCVLNPLLSGLVTPPGKFGVDIVVCDGQPLGLPLNAGGPTLGVYATKPEYRKYVPGRLVGKVTDIRGDLAYALVYEDREQHVARERATSNICSNQALNALRALMYLTTLGEAGVARIAALNTRKAHYLAEKLTKIPGVALAFSGGYFNEFIVALPKPLSRVLTDMQAAGIFAGIDVSGQYGHTHALRVCVTEVKNRADLDAYATTLAKVLS